MIEPLITPVASETDASTSALRKMFARSVRFNLQAEFVIHLIRVGGLIYLAHRLAPSDFGLLRILIVIVGLAGLFCTAGFSEAVIQRKTLIQMPEPTVLQGLVRKLIRNLSETKSKWLFFILADDKQGASINNTTIYANHFIIEE